MDKLLQVAATIDINHTIEENLGKEFDHILILLQDLICNRFKKLFPQEFDEIGFDNLWNALEQVASELIQDWLDENSVDI